GKQEAQRINADAAVAAWLGLAARAVQGYTTRTLWRRTLDHAWGLKVYGTCSAHRLTGRHRGNRLRFIVIPGLGTRIVPIYFTLYEWVCATGWTIDDGR